MKKSVLLFIAALMLVAARGWAAPAAGNEPGVITVSVDALDFGELEIGYPVTKSITVTGENLTGNINLVVESDHAYFYQVTPATITPEQAANGVNVKVKCLPVSPYVKPANIRLTSPGAQDVLIPLTADPYYPEPRLAKGMTQYFTAFVGQQDKLTGVIHFPDAEVPTDPTLPLVDMSGGEDDGEEAPMLQMASVLSNDYSITLEGPDRFNFIVTMVKTSFIVNICTVQIVYAPLTVGTHQATLVAHCNNAGVPYVTIPLRGESTQVLGDLSGNGVIDIGDVTGMINLLLTGKEDSPIGDMDGDGRLAITDVTLLINRLLSED